MTREQTRVYVIDDDESVRKAFKRLLRSVNFEAETFASAVDFLKTPKPPAGS